MDRRFRFRVGRTARRHGRTCRARVFPAGKDKTDGELAVAAAIARGATSLVLAGAFGGPRADHAFLHLALALQACRGGHADAADQRRAGGRPLLPAQTDFDYATGTLFSILGFSELTGLSVSGARWPLDRVTMAVRLVAAPSPTR